MNNYRVYCITENKQHNVVSLTEPTHCPVSAEHIINGNLTTILELDIIDPVLQRTDATAQVIDATYDHKEIDGHAYYRKKRAELVKLILVGTITEDDADFIDVKLQNVQMKINTGDWKSAKKRLQEATVEGAFTQSMYDEYLTEIDDYILNNY